ncbi:hypothetical protein Aduo_018375 [Ancylostoma duodenale]
MEELARLLKVNTSEVLEEAKRLATMANQGQTTYFQAPPQAAPDARNEMQPHYVQLDREDFDSVEYHATFDPIAAAEARKEERPLSEAEGIERTLDNTNQLARKVNPWSAIGMPKHIFIKGPSRKMRFSSAWRSTIHSLLPIIPPGEVGGNCEFLTAATQARRKEACEDICRPLWIAGLQTSRINFKKSRPVLCLCCNLAKVYSGLQDSETFPKVVNETNAHKFFRQFVKDIVTRAYNLPNRKYVTARKRPHANNFIEFHTKSSLTS